jgi:hypothetical protein
MKAALLLVLLAVPAVAAEPFAIVEAYFEDYDRAVIRKLTANAGSPIYISFKMTGFKRDPKENVRLTYTIDCFDPFKTALAVTEAGKIDEALSPQDQKWRPKVNWNLTIPPHAPAGEYEVVITARDAIGAAKAEHRMPFQVRGVAVTPDTPLGITRFEFADSEDGAAKDPAQFKPGSQLWARFHTVGLQPSPEKEVILEQDVTVSDSAGKVMYSKPRAFAEKAKEFYPLRFLNSVFNLELQPKLKAGEYTIRIDARDIVAKKETSYEAKFTVAP